MDIAADDRQLLEVLIGRTASHSVRLNLAELLEASESELVSLGLPRPARRRLLACSEVARRYQPKACVPEPITTPAHALAHLGRLRSSGRETLAVLLLDVRLSLLAVDVVAIGTVAHVAVEPREVFAPAVTAGATSLVLAHNHPSGDPEPSAPDADFTRAMVEAGRILSIDVLDHLIVSRRGFYSFRRAGRM
ncbi:MAG TPA: JAB domain-containing protein [Candidatus Dormibacteraeota bacterium]|nr:JAB domain-containing protein [Candidatus Dormibacteraeota bacterium]